jgi:hypothetical protein
MFYFMISNRTYNTKNIEYLLTNDKNKNGSYIFVILCVLIKTNKYLYGEVNTYIYLI